MAFLKEILVTQGSMKNRVGKMEQSDEATVEQTPTFQGLIFEPIPKDGSCLFHAVGLHLELDADYLRKIVAAHMEANREELMCFYSGTEEKLNQHIEAIRSGNEWADNLEIAVLQRLLNRPIIIARADANPTIPDNLSELQGEPIFVYYNGHTHYDAFILQDGFQAREILNHITTAIGQGKAVTYIAVEPKKKFHSEAHYPLDSTWSHKHLMFEISQTPKRKSDGLRFPSVEVFRYFSSKLELRENKSENKRREVFHAKIRQLGKKYEMYVKVGSTLYLRNSILIEYASYRFAHLLIGHGIPDGFLSKRNEEVVLVSRVVPYKINEEDVKNQFLKVNLNKLAFSEFFLLMLLLSPGDLRYENCGYEKLEDGTARLLFYDNEDNFQDGRLLFSKEEKWIAAKNALSVMGTRVGLNPNALVSPVTTINSFIYGMPLLEDQIEGQAVLHFLQKQPQEIIRQLVVDLEQKCQELSISEHPFKHELIHQLHNRFGILRLILEDAEVSQLTFINILERFNQKLSAAYRNNISSTLRSKTSCTEFSQSVANITDFKEIIKQIEQFGAVYQDSSFIPGQVDFNVEKFNGLTSYLQTFCLKKAIQLLNLTTNGLAPVDVQKRLIGHLTQVKFSRLYTFRLEGLTQLNSSQLNLILNNLTKQKEKLVQLSIINCHVTDTDIPTIVNVCRQLCVEALDLSCNPLVSILSRSKATFFLMQYPFMVPTLKTICLDNCQQLEVVKIQGINLERLKARNNPVLRSIQVETKSVHATCQLSNCHQLEENPEIHRWVQLIELDMRLANFGPIPLPEHLFQLIRNMNQSVYTYEYHAYALAHDDLSAGALLETLNILPDSFYQQLHDLMYDEDQRIEIALEIYHELKIGHLDLLKEDQHSWEVLYQAYQNGKEQEQDSDKKDVRQDLLERKQQIIEFTQQHHIIQRYIEYLKYNNQISLQSLILFLRINQYRQVVIYEVDRDRDGAHNPRLSRIDNLDTDVSGEMVYLLHQNDGFESTFKMLIPSSVTLMLDKRLNQNELRLLMFAINVYGVKNIECIEMDFFYISGLSSLELEFLINVIKDEAFEPTLYLIFHDAKLEMTRASAVSQLKALLPKNTPRDDSDDGNVNQENGGVGIPSYSDSESPHDQDTENRAETLRKLKQTLDFYENQQREREILLAARPYAEVPLGAIRDCFGSPREFIEFIRKPPNEAIHKAPIILEEKLPEQDIDKDVSETVQMKGRS